MHIQWDGGRSIMVTYKDGPDKTTFKVMASSETGNPALRRESTTWRWEHNGEECRVQIQVTQI